MGNVILSLDPSSTCIGWATLTGRAKLTGGGIIKPDVKGVSYDRVADMGSGLYTLCEHTEPDVILIEWTIGKVGQRRHKGAGAGLSVYGAGVGWAGATCYWYQRQSVEQKIVEIHAVLENDWTRGVPKKDRQLAVAQEYPSYPAEQDPGGDLADAIGMAQWWLKERMSNE